MHLAVFGVTGLGKTYTLYHTLKAAGRHVLMVRHLEELYMFDDHTDIIFDDISFEHTRPELLIHLCDRDFPAPIRILRQVIKIPETVNKWFTHNNSCAYEPILASIEQLAAINRRLNIVEVHSRKEIEEVLHNHLSQRLKEDVNVLLEKFGKNT